MRLTNYLFIGLCFYFLTSCSHSNKGLIKTKNYSLARDKEWASVDLYGKDKYVLGFSDELIQKIISIEKTKIDLLSVGQENLVQGLIDNKYEAIFSSIEPVAQYAQLFSFSKPFLSLGPVLVVRSNVEVTQISEMEKKIIAIPEGQEGVNFNVTYPDIITKTYSSIPVVLEELSRGQVDGAMIPWIVAQTYCRDIYQGVLKVATPPAGSLGLRLIAKKQNQRIVDQFNQGLDTLIKNGDYQKLLTKWKIN